MARSHGVDPGRPDAGAADPLDRPIAIPNPGTPVSGYRLSLGLLLELRSGIAPGLSPGGSVSGDLSPRGPGPGLRLSLSAGYGSGRTQGVPLATAVYAGRVELSVWTWHWSGGLSLSPCLAADLGLVDASAGDAGGRRDRGLWAATGAHLRAGVAVGDAVVLELQLGAVVPLVRYALGGVDGSDLYRIDALVPHLALGTAIAP